MIIYTNTYPSTYKTSLWLIRRLGGGSDSRRFEFALALPSLATLANAFALAFAIAFTFALSITFVSTFNRFRILLDRIG